MTEVLRGRLGDLVGLDGHRALVVGLASWALGDALREGGAGATGLVPVPWSGLGLVLVLAFPRGIAGMLDGRRS